MSQDGIVVYAFLAFLATFGGTGKAHTEESAQADSGIYCPKVAPLLVAKWEERKRPAKMVLHNSDGYLKVMITSSASATAIVLEGAFKGRIEDSDADGIADKMIGGGWGSFYDSSQESSGNFSGAQAKYERECEALWKTWKNAPGQ